MLTRSPRAAVCALGIIFSLGSAACGGEQSTTPGTPQPGAPAPAPTDTADGPGVIIGTMTFAGTPPAPKPLPMDSDPKCAADPKAVSERLVVGPGGGLQHVFVHVKDGLGNRTYAVPTTPVSLDQKGCRYIPHVFGVQVGQPIRVSNSDATLHNVNAAPKNNRGFNFGQPATVPAVTRTFDKPEVMVPMRCDVHSWMNAYAGVVAHPFFAVTKEDGSFEIKGLPPGTYTVEAWHEELGTQTQSVTVDGKTPGEVTVAFKATS
ncbi:MAG: carboxypeptidase regulatory-like domain-containing protein [Vicinamibacterales bacterium]